jgi:hypothetical protein
VEGQLQGHQAGEHPGFEERVREAGGFRVGEVAGDSGVDRSGGGYPDGGDDETGDDSRDGGVYVARASIGAEGGRAGRYISFGFVLYELFANRRPFTGTSDVDVMHAILHGTATPLGELRGDCRGRCGVWWRRRWRSPRVQRRLHPA